MTSLDASLFRPAARRTVGAEWLRPSVAWIAIAAALLLIGHSVAVALGSPLLAIVADGMVFLAGVAGRGAIGQRRR